MPSRHGRFEKYRKLAVALALVASAAGVLAYTLTGETSHLALSILWGVLALANHRMKLG